MALPGAVDTAASVQVSAPQHQQRSDSDPQTEKRLGQPRSAQESVLIPFQEPWESRTRGRPIR